jgi:hypothetical protein
MCKYAHLALTTITQLYLTFVTFLKYYQLIYIINNVISSLFKCYQIRSRYTMSTVWYQITGFGYTFSIFKLVLCAVLDDSFFHSLFLLYHSKRTLSFFQWLLNRNIIKWNMLVDEALKTIHMHWLMLNSTWSLM